MLGWLLFGGGSPAGEDWGNIGRAMLSLFVRRTLEDFPRYMERAMEVHPVVVDLLRARTFILITVASIIINVLIGWIWSDLDCLEEAREMERRKRLSAESRTCRLGADIALFALSLERITIRPRAPQSSASSRCSHLRGRKPQSRF